MKDSFGDLIKLNLGQREGVSFSPTVIHSSNIQKQV